MSVRVTDLITGCLVKIGDPRGRRTTRPEALQFYNEVQLELATSLMCLEDDFYFDITGGYEAYAYPEGRIQVKAVRFSKVAAPDGLDDYEYLRESFESEAKDLGSSRYLTSAVTHYVARASWLEFIGTPPDSITNGAIVTMAYLPTWLAAETPDDVMELPDLCRVMVQEGMEILARNTDRDRVAAAADMQRWREKIPDLEAKIADPSRDRRSSYRPQRSPAAWRHR